MSSSDARAVQARKEHAAVSASERQASQHRAARDSLVRQLRREDPREWSYGRLAKQVGCSPELIAYICRFPDA